ncbi:FeoB-associated Cys-rich membrane protein [Bengtsoniella intestinalis]|uniref:FeoB-associated Cys-rich membrane protein n=1 Tax=Bengtsoniella intestinalis TaxID=3073143 RepID=UPI00391F5CB3
MIDVIIGLVVLAIVGGAIGYIVHAKKNGVKCIGCAVGGKCSGSHHEGGCSGCSCDEK